MGRLYSIVSSQGSASPAIDPSGGHPAVGLAREIVPVTAPIGTLAGTLPSGLTYVLSNNPGGKYALEGNLIKTASALTAGTSTIAIAATDPEGWTKTFSFDMSVVAALGPTTATANTGDVAGTLIAQITGLADGEAIASIDSTSGRYAIVAPDKIVRGLTASTAGVRNLLVTTNFGRTLTIAITITETAAPNQFYESAARVLAMSQNKRTIQQGSLSVDISNTGPSVINGRTIAQGGIVATASVPNGIAAPLNPGEKWIVTKTPANQTASNLGYAPGQSKLFHFNGQRFDFKGSITAGKSFTIRWSEDDGLTWLEYGPVGVTTVSWCLVDFGNAKPRVIEIVGEDEQFQIYGFNFDTGNAAPAAFDTSRFPKGMMFGDSYVFGQGAGPGSPSGNGQRATRGMARKAAEFIGWTQIYGHGFRTNGFAQTQGGVQSRFADRIKLPTDDSLSEGAHWGALDYVIICGSINDITNATGTRYDDVVLALQNLREKQPTALIVFAVGANPPTSGEGTTWIPDYVNAFKFVFGNTQAEQLENGALLINGSRATGENWAAAGAAGSSPYFPASGDTLHPNPAGHEFFGQRFGKGVVDLATAIVASSGGSTPTNKILLEDGSLFLMEDGSNILQE